MIAHTAPLILLHVFCYLIAQSLFITQRHHPSACRVIYCICQLLAVLYRAMILLALAGFDHSIYSKCWMMIVVCLRAGQKLKIVGSGNFGICFRYTRYKESEHKKRDFGALSGW